METYNGLILSSEDRESLFKARAIDSASKPKSYMAPFFIPEDEFNAQQISIISCDLLFITAETAAILSSEMSIAL